jgi:FtsH-binding integral membrane protein
MMAHSGGWGEFPRTGLLPRAGAVKPPNGAYPRDTLACMRSARLAVLLDVCCVLVFVIIGRASHTKGEALGGIASTSWPFLCGLAAGWVLSRAWRRPLALRPAGISVWLSTVALGMVLRVVSGQGIAVAFIGVALAFLGLFLLGWRLLARLVTR